MGGFSIIQTIWSEDLEQLGQTTLLSARTGASPHLILDDPATGTRTRIDLGAGLIDPSKAQVHDLDPASATHNVSVNGRSGDLPAQTYDTDGHNGHAYLGSVGFAGNKLAQLRLDAAGQDWVVMAPVHGQGLSSYKIKSDGSLKLAARLDDTEASGLNGVASLASVEIGGASYVLAASQHEDSLTVLRLGSSGQLTLVDTLGAQQDVPVDQPSAVETVSVGGKHFAILASFGTGSVTVFEIGASGQLQFTDQVNDTRDTRFDQAAALDVAVVDERVLVAVAGGDGGVSLFQMLPDGRLILRDTLVDGMDTALDAVSALQFVQTDNGLELFALSLRDTGLTRLSVDIGGRGITASQKYGTDNDDILTATPEVRDIRGGDGDDILIDGAGHDNLRGGAGADLFVIGADGEKDHIRDFDPTVDRIDLSGAGNVRSLYEVTISNASNGIKLTWDDETLFIYGTMGTSLTADILAPTVVFAGARVSFIERAPLTGTPDADTFIWSDGPDTIDGGAGFDTQDYSLAPRGATVDLTDAARNGGAADGDVLTSIERLVGTAYGDDLRGNAAANTLIGMDGNDRLAGGDGNDWLLPGTGTDTLDGGAGSDMLSLADLPAFARVSLTTKDVVSGGSTSTLISIENVTGTIYADVIEGDAGSNRLRGLGDYDWFLGTEGADSYDGGDGRDMISYVYAPGSVTVNLQTGRGEAGMALGDTYTSIERVTGSIHADLIYGGDMEEDMRGVGGYDWFVGSEGRSRYDGGSGLDTVAYWFSDVGVAASLNLGRGSTGDAFRDLYTSIENLTGSGHGDDLTGDGGRNVLRGLGGDDRLLGYGGVDRLEGGRGNDSLDGGWGWDVAIFSGKRAEYNVTARPDGTQIVTDTVRSRDGTDTLDNIEAMQFEDGLFYF